MAGSRKWWLATAALLATMTQAERVDLINQRIAGFLENGTTAPRREWVTPS